MTIDERVENLLAAKDSADFKPYLRLVFLEVARDQRHACAEAVMTVEGDSNNPWMIDKDHAHSAVMNATLEAK